MGKTEGKNYCHRNVTFAMSSISLFVRGSSVENLFKLERLGIPDPAEVLSRKEMEITALNHFTKTAIVDNEGRYEVQLPWGADHIILNSNEDICKELLKSTTKKLLQKNKFDDYESVLNQWIDDGVIEDVPFNETEEKRAARTQAPTTKNYAPQHPLHAGVASGDHPECNRWSQLGKASFMIKDFPVPGKDSRTISSKRLEQLWRRLNRDPKLIVPYTQFIEEYLALDHMEKVLNIDEITFDDGFFLPHQWCT
ncbi:uncharacterized protein NPIL_27721 [Nephila pilipes]|uniref:Uncharacterized protein n=1 Tax=Nephila pilipes TaxID=299642 RepID=A0A8X6PP21_NEPPI|nr:uncharacterized protein NPIL_27721 [Nephila pilipes]